MKFQHIKKVLSIKNSLKGFKKIATFLLLIIVLTEIGLISGVIKPPDFFTSPDKRAQKMVDECSDQRNWGKCYGEKLAELSKRNGISYSLDILSSLSPLDKRARECHIMAHHLALVEVEKNPSDWTKIFKYVDVSDCESGFLHGGLEGLSRYDGSIDINKDRIIEICQQIKGLKDSYIVNQACAHAFGHLLLGQNYKTEIKKGIDLSVAECTSLPEDLVRECGAGVFMESYTRENLYYHWDVPKVEWSTKKYIAYQEELCGKYQGIIATSCWQEMAQLYSSFYQLDPKSVFEACSRAPEWENTGYCYMKAANTFVTGSNDDEAYLNSICEPLITNPDYHKACIKGALLSLLTSSSLIPKTIKFCESIDEEYKVQCFETLLQVLKTESRMDERICDMMPAEYRVKCLPTT